MKKVLIIAGGLQIGGAERIAANISKYAPAGQFELHYLVFEGIENVYGPEIEAAGGTVYTIPSPSRGYVKYVRTLSDLMKKNKYAVVHSHTMFNSGINLLLARINRIPIRIAHSHTTKTERRVSAPQRIYEAVMRWLIKVMATDLFSCGVEAGYWMFGKTAFNRKGVLISNGIDTEQFAWSEAKRAEFRDRYGLADAFVIGHSGTLIPLKNQIFLIGLMPEILKRKPNARLMLLGSGSPEYREELFRAACDAHVEDRVIFCGGVNNVSDYLNAFDVFAFPSLREGTPLALIEAQTNGLTCVISDRVPGDAQLTDLIRIVPLDNEEAWIDHLCGAERSMDNYPKKIEDMGYSARKACLSIYQVYCR